MFAVELELLGINTHGVSAVVIKNCDPFVFGPALAIERLPISCYTDH